MEPMVLASRLGVLSRLLATPLRTGLQWTRLAGSFPDPFHLQSSTCLHERSQRPSSPASADMSHGIHFSMKKCCRGRFPQDVASMTLPQGPCLKDVASRTLPRGCCRGTLPQNRTGGPAVRLSWLKSSACLWDHRLSWLMVR